MFNSFYYERRVHCNPEVAGKERETGERSLSGLLKVFLEELPLHRFTASPHRCFLAGRGLQSIYPRQFFFQEGHEDLKTKMSFNSKFGVVIVM